MSRGKRRQRQPQSATGAESATTRPSDDEQRVAARAGPAAGQGGAREAAAVARHAENAASAGRGARGEAQEAAAAAGEEEEGGKAEEDRALGARVPPRAEARAQVAPAPAARAQDEARGGQAALVGVAEAPAGAGEEEEAQEEEEAHGESHRHRADRHTGQEAVETHPQVGQAPSPAKEGAAPAAPKAVAVRVLLDGGNERAVQRLARGMETVPKARSVTAGSLEMYEDPHALPPFLEDEEINDPELGKLIVPKIRSFNLDSTASHQLDRYISEELHPEATADPNSLHHMHPASSPCSSMNGSEATIPHSKSLVTEDIPPATVFQAVPSSNIEVVEVIAEQSWLITKLTVQLLWALRMSKRWIMCALRLVWFVVVLLPPLSKEVFYWLWDPNIHKNIIYGLNRRNLLDVYVPPRIMAHIHDLDSSKPARYPVVVFISGGAWIIGYKAWGALMGRVLSCFGVVVVMPDYRNFPQGILPDMVEDATRALQWVFDNIHLFGGDRDNVTLIGQSAGAHISMCALLEQVERKEQAILSGHRSRSGSIVSSSHSSLMSSDFLPDAMTRTLSSSSNLSLQSCESVESTLTRPPTWELKQIRSFIGISGPYNMEASLATFHRHGFDKGVVERIMAHRLAYYSPSLRLLAKSELREYNRALDDFPPVYLFHGTADKTVNWQSTEQLTRALEACRIPVKTRFFEGKTHTDPIIEDPICGDDFLLNDIVAIMKERAPVDSRTGRPVFALGEIAPEKRYYPTPLVRLARLVNPF